VRIESVELSEDMIKIGTDFEINITICKERFRRFDGELHVYLSRAGFCDELIGNMPVFIHFGKESKYLEKVNCSIDEVESNWYQESYALKVVLFEERFRGNLIIIDTFSLESLRIYSKLYEMNKLRIKEFNPSDEWLIKERFTESIASKTSKIEVIISNLAVYDYDVMVRIDLVEKTSLGIPLVKGFGEIRKKIGSETLTISAYKDAETVIVFCELSDADLDRREFDVQAVLFAVVDGQYYEIDTSTIQTIRVPLSLGEKISIYGPMVWLFFIAAIGTIILLIVTVKLIIPFTKLKGDEVKEAVDKIRQRKK
jgi:hypothetical protein